MWTHKIINGVCITIFFIYEKLKNYEKNYEVEKLYTRVAIKTKVKPNAEPKAEPNQMGREVSWRLFLISLITERVGVTPRANGKRQNQVDKLSK